MKRLPRSQFDPRDQGLRGLLRGHVNKMTKAAREDKAWGAVGGVAGARKTERKSRKTAARLLACPRRVARNRAGCEAYDTS